MARPYVTLRRSAWAELSNHTTIRLDEETLDRLRGIGDPTSQEDVSEVYRPLTQLLHLTMVNAGRLNDPAWDSPLRDPGLAAGEGWVPAGAGPSARVELRDDAGSPSGRVARIEGIDSTAAGRWCQTMQVQPGRSYVYLVHYQAVADVGSHVDIGSWDYRRFGMWHSYAGHGTRDSGGWSSYWRLVQPPAGVRNISVCPAIVQGRGTVEIAGVQFIPLDSILAVAYR